MIRYLFLAAFLLVCSVSRADTVRKPTVCERFQETIAQGNKQKIGICTDGKRPRIFTEWAYVTVGDKRYVIGR